MVVEVHDGCQIYLLLGVLLNEVIEENFTTIAICSCFQYLVFLIDQLYLLLALDLYLHGTHISVRHL